MKYIPVLGLGFVVVATVIFAYTRHLPPPAAAIHGNAPAWSVNERLIAKLQLEVEHDPAASQWKSALGNAYLQKARETSDPSYYEKSEALFEQSLELKGNNVEAMVGQASLAMSRHDFRRAREIADRAVAQNPYLAPAYGILADALVELGSYDEAIATLDRMIRLKPNLSAYSRIAYIRELTGDIEGAIQAMRMAVESGAPDAENTAWCMVQLGNLYLSSGRLDEADQHYHLALVRFPDYVHALAGEARLSTALQDWDSAIHYYQKAIDQVPLPEFLIGQGEAYEKSGRPQEAERAFDVVRAIQRMYTAKGVNMDLEIVAFALDHGGDIRQSLETVKKEWLWRKSVKTADVYAWALYRAGRFSDAKAMMQQALRLGSKDPGFLKHAAIIGARAG